MVGCRPLPQRLLLGCLRRSWLVWVSCSLFLYINRSQLTKNRLLWEKSCLNATFNLIFLVLGWPWVGDLVGFMTMFTCFPTEHILVIANTLLLGPSLDLFQRYIPESRKRFPYSPRFTAGVPCIGYP